MADSQSAELPAPLPRAWVSALAWRRLVSVAEQRALHSPDDARSRSSAASLSSDASLSSGVSAPAPLVSPTPVDSSVPAWLRAAAIELAGLQPSAWVALVSSAPE